MDLESIKNKLYNQGRDLEVAIFNYLFESDDRDMVSYALSIYQNKDGGFGHGLEPDSTNPNSSPFQTSVALEILCTVGFRFSNLDEFTKELVTRTFKYLNQTLVNNRWPSTIPSNNNFPCAVWWMHDESKPIGINPTASILASILHLSPRQSSLYKKSFGMSLEIVELFLNQTMLEKHDLIVLSRLYQALIETEINKELLDQFKNKLFNAIQEAIDPIDKWVGYATMPYDFPLDDENYGISHHILEAGVEHLLKTMKHNYWEPTWVWYKDEDTFEIQAIKWHGILINQYVSYIKHIQK